MLARIPKAHPKRDMSASCDHGKLVHANHSQILLPSRFCWILLDLPDTVRYCRSFWGLANLFAHACQDASGRVAKFALHARSGKGSAECTCHAATQSLPHKTCSRKSSCRSLPPTFELSTTLVHQGGHGPRSSPCSDGGMDTEEPWPSSHLGPSLWRTFAGLPRTYCTADFMRTKTYYRTQLELTVKPSGFLVMTRVEHG